MKFPLPCRGARAFRLQEGSMRSRKRRDLRCRTLQAWNWCTLFVKDIVSHPYLLICLPLTFTHYKVNGDENEGVFHSDILDGPQ